LAAVWAIALWLGGVARRLEAWLCAVAAVALLASPAFADVKPEKRVALVIGNGAYQNAPRLDNATFDARAVADAFRKLGFEVVDGYDLNVEQMRAKVSDFSADLPDAKSAVIYYAGHGISVDDENYLIPTDIVLKSPTDLDLGAISVSLVLKQMKREDRVNVVILDACRDNPFAEALARNKTRAIVGERGLSRIHGDLARGTLIAFASDPKSTALDGPPGQHSPFTEAFLDHVFDPGVSIDTVMSRVRTEVWEKTHHGQLPWVNTSLIGDYVLNRGICIGTAADCPTPKEPAQEGATAAEVAALPATPPAAQTQEDLLWESAQHSNLRADYQAYLDAFPNGFFAQMAKNRIASLENPAAAPAERASPAKPASETEPAAAAPTAKAIPAAPAEKDWKAEVGTADTEKALDLTPAEQKEIQQRLAALDLYKGPATGALDPATRLALTEWQRLRGAAPTSFLGSMQLAALRAESEDAYQKFLAAQPAPEPAVRQAVRPPTRAAREPERRAAREPIRKHEPARRVTKRTAHPATDAAETAATSDSGKPRLASEGRPAGRQRRAPDRTATGVPRRVRGRRRHGADHRRLPPLLKSRDLMLGADPLRR
jgi:uncharacterized caspase-like protein